MRRLSSVCVCVCVSVSDVDRRSERLDGGLNRRVVDGSNSSIKVDGGANGKVGESRWMDGQVQEISKEARRCLRRKSENCDQSGAARTAHSRGGRGN